MTAPQTCIAHGLAVRSCVTIPGATAVAPDAATTVDIDIAMGEIADGGEVIGPYRLQADALVFEASGVARFRCQATSIVIAPIGDASDEAIAGFLVATALPATLWMRGDIVLHGAAAQLPGAAGVVAILGPSGSGKSTVLSRLVKSGARIVADDSIRVTRTPSGFEASGLAGGYFLGGEPRVFNPVPAETRLTAAPLIGIAVLDSRRSAEGPDIRRMEALGAFQALLGNRHRPRVPRLLGLEPALLARIGALAWQLPVHHWARREGVVELEGTELDLLAGR